jgi:mannose-1-phosphate guanylyltransferase
MGEIKNCPLLFRQQSLNYGCVVADGSSHSMLHYVEKPATYISPNVNCGVYIFSMAIFDRLQQVFQKKQADFYE